MSSLPEWMLRPNDADGLDSSPSERIRPRRSGAVRRAVAGFVRLVADALGEDECASRPGLLQCLEARFKVLGLIGLIVVATFLRSLESLLVCYLACVLLAGVSGVGMRRFAEVWLVVPLFTAGVMLPAALNIVTEGRPVWTIFHFARTHFGPWPLPSMLSVTDAGLVVAGRIVLRTAVCVSLAVLLRSTTPRAKLFKGLRMLGVPTMFVMLLGMMERYLGLMVRAAEEIHLAKISRSISAGSLRQEQAWVAAGIGSLFRRSRALSQGVYMAMISRGYTGEVHLLEEPRASVRDWAFLLMVGAFAGLLIWMG